jgi:hypothetical protein
MSAALVAMYLSQMEAIKAEESLEQVLRLQIGYGLVKKQEADKYIQEWQRKAGRGTERKRAKTTGTPPGLGVRKHKNG